MPCYHPVTAWFSQSKNPSGKRSLQFTPSEGFGDAVQISCGRCVGCRLERSRQWAIRCMHETQLHEDSCFLTLTYSPEKLPADRSLCKRHLQLFFKRLRRRTGSKLRYFACGEYGGKLERPHYHAIVWGLDFPDKVVHTRNGQGDAVYSSAALESIWGLGFCTIGSVSFDSAAYVARYSMKKITGSQAKAHYERVDPVTGEVHRLVPEFLLMSLKPGIAQGWFDQFKGDVFPSDFCVQKGQKLRIPKFYDSKLGETELAELKKRRKAFAKRHRKDNSPRRLRDREVVTHAALNLKTRTI